jgi:SAM-dependent methyltransferase
MLGKLPRADDFQMNARYSARRAKDIVLGERLAVVDGAPSWFYTAFEDRSTHDPLTNSALQYVQSKSGSGARVLVTGCGVGIMVFHLADFDFREVVGVDLMVECIEVANKIKDEYRYTNVSFSADNCFQPNLVGTFDVITFMHWLYSAWGGNYGNAGISEAWDPQVREKLLNDLLAYYLPHVNPHGVMVVELVDAVADYRLASDHPMGQASLGIYPVRHTPEQVRRCATANGLAIIDQKMSVVGHQPRTTYFLKKS